MTITAKNIGRINVWPTYAIAREADTEECKFVGQLTVWQTNEEARANMSHEEGGGGEDWVPANAKIHIDLVGGDPQGRAWVEGVGVVAVDTLLGSDANADVGWGVTSAYHPEYLIADHGYRIPPQASTPDQNVAFIGAARAKVLAGVTARIAIEGILDGENVYFVALAATGAASVTCAIILGTGQELISGAGDDLYSPIAVCHTPGPGSVNVMAFTLTSTRFDHAGSGSAALANALTETDYPTSGEDQIVAILLTPAYEHPAIQSITLYDPLPSTDGLSELSEVA